MADSGPVHISGIRMAHVQGGEREVQTHHKQPIEGPIVWAKLVRQQCGKVRVGHGRSGLVYRVEQGVGEWRVLVLASRGREIVVGSAKLHDHALALAGMWEQAVASGRVDID